jgi:hypothetical protein
MDNDDNNGKELVTESVANQVAALTYQSQLTALTAATTTQCTAQKLTAIEANQQVTHGTLHQIIAQLNTVMFNASDVGRGTQGYGAGQGYRAGRGCKRAHGHGGRCGFDRGPPQYVGGSFLTPQGRSFPHAPQGGGFPQGYPGGYQGGPARPPAFVPKTFVPPGGAQGGQPGPLPYRDPAGFHGPAQTQQQLFSNLVKRFANWNVCYSCGFDVADGHTGILLTKKMSFVKVTSLCSSQISFRTSMKSCLTTGGIVLTVFPFNIAMLGPHTLIAVPMSLTVTRQSLIKFSWIPHFISALDGNAKPAWRLQTRFSPWICLLVNNDMLLSTVSMKQ